MKNLDKTNLIIGLVALAVGLLALVLTAVGLGLTLGLAL